MIHRTQDSSSATVQNVGVNHGGLYVPMSKQFLNRADEVYGDSSLTDDAARHKIPCVMKRSPLRVGKPVPIGRRHSQSRDPACRGRAA
jgi:hypothetical protein